MKQKPLDSKIILKAKKIANSVRLCSDYKFYKIGAVIFNDKKILVAASNENKTNPMQAEYNKYRPFDARSMKACIHAEINALLKFKRLYPEAKGEDVSILVYRETKDGQCGLARPCPACEKALRDFHITNIYYTGKDSMCYEKYNEEN